MRGFESRLRIGLWVALWLAAGAGSVGAAVCADARIAFANRQFSAAQELLWLCWQKTPGDNTDTVFLLGLTYRELKNYQSGLERLAGLDAANRETADGLYLRGYLLFRLGEFKQSVDALHRAFLLNARDWRVHQAFALDFVMLGEQAGAVYEFRTAAALNPRNSEIPYQLSRYYYTLNRFEEAIQAAEAALKLQPDYMEVENNLGLCYEALERHSEALQSYEKAAQLDDAAPVKDPWPYLNFAAYLMTQARFQASLEYAEKAIGVAPNAAKPRLAAGKALLKLGRYKEAEAQFQQAIALDADELEAYFQLGTALRMLGDPSGAAKYLSLYNRRRAERKPEHPTPPDTR